MKLLILVDYRNQFWLSARHKEANFDMKIFKRFFEELGVSTDFKRFSDINFREDDYTDTFVIYQSSEDRGLHYKSFIEDILLGLKLKGAILIPRFELFRAHENKVFMEILRDISGCEDIKNIRSHCYGTYEEYLSDIGSYEHGIYVIKMAAGAQSRNVRLLTTNNEKHRIPKRMSRTFHPYDYMINVIKPFLKKKYPDYRSRSNHRKKFLVQNFIKDLPGDYKVLVYGEKYYVLSRRVRKGDFRASGSGLFSYPETPPNALLDFAKLIYDSFETPFVGLDIACDEQSFYLLEFQFEHFGNYTLERSKWYFKRDSAGGWVRVDEISIIEKEFAISICDFINKGISNRD